MIHTFLIQKEIIKEEEFSNIFNSIIGFFKDESLSNNTVTIYRNLTLNEIGLNEIRLKKVKVDSKYKFKNKYLELLINPAKILNKNNPIAIFKEEDINNLIEKLDNILSYNFRFNNTSCINWQVKRIDYTRNINLNTIDLYNKNDIDLAELYIDLFRRADTSNLKVPYNLRSKRRTQTKGSFRLSNKSITINFYNKFDERKNKKKFDEMEDAKNILRLEIQCNQPKINNIKNKNKWDYNILLNYLDPQIAHETLYKYYKKIIGEGDYYKLTDAIKIINNSKFRTDKKENLVEILKLINKKRSVTRAREEFKNNIKFNQYLKDIRGLNINVVTIPERWNVRFLPNPWNVQDL